MSIPVKNCSITDWSIYYYSPLNHPYCLDGKIWLCVHYIMLKPLNKPYYYFWYNIHIETVSLLFTMFSRLHIDFVPKVEKLPKIQKKHEITFSQKVVCPRRFCWCIAKKLIHFPRVVPIVQKQQKVHRINMPNSLVFWIPRHCYEELTNIRYRPWSFEEQSMYLKTWTLKR